jgi:flagellar protein FlgJ
MQTNLAINSYNGTGPSSLDTDTPRSLKEAAQQFESVFVAKLFETMRRTIPSSKVMGDDSSMKMYQQMLDNEFANKISQAGGLGIGEMLYRQLSGGSPHAAQPSGSPGQEKTSDEN